MRTLKRRPFVAPSWKDSISPMVDMVFLLLIYFVVTYNPTDRYAEIDISDRKDDRPGTPPVSVLTITLQDQGFDLNGSTMNGRQLGATLRKLSSYDTKQGIVIRCPDVSPHGQLVDAMDVCHNAALTNISILTIDSI